MSDEETFANEQKRSVAVRLQLVYPEPELESGELREDHDETDDDPEDEVEEDEEEEEHAVTHHRCVSRGRRRRRFGALKEITGEQYVREVTCAGPGVRVVLFLYRRSPLCTLLNHHLTSLASKFPETKFLKIEAGRCVPEYPDRSVPTLFVYECGRILASMIGEAQCGGRNVLQEELMWMLGSVEAISLHSY